MAVQPDTVTGTLTTTAGSVNFTTVGTQLLAREHLPGDRFLVNGLELQIATITGENSGTLTEECPPEAAVSGFPVRLRWQPDGARVAAQTRNLIDLLGNGTLQSLAEVDGNADELLIFIGPNTLSTINRTDLVEGVDYNVLVNTLPERDAYDAELAGFSVLVADVGDGRAALYVKNSDTSGDWSSPAYITGPVGPMVDVEAGTTTTLPAGSPATVTVTPGTNVYYINIGVPQGFQGVPGQDGAEGPQGAGLDIGALGDLANRDNYDSEPEGFTYFDTENGDLYIREGATGNWAGPIPFQGPPGTSGAIITKTTGVGNSTAGPYTLNAAPFDVNSVWVSVSGVEQYNYSISGNLITFDFPIPASVPWQVKTSGPLPIGIPSDDSVGADQINGAEADAIRTKIGAGDVVGPASSGDATIALFDGTTGKLIKDSGLTVDEVGSGDVVGPSSAVDNRIAVFDGTTGKLIKDGGLTIDEIGAFGIPVGMVTMQNGPVDPGHIRMGEGGTYDRVTYPDLAIWMDANGTTAFGLNSTQIANGALPDWRDYSPRTGGGSLGPAVGAKQEDALQGHRHYRNSENLSEYALRNVAGTNTFAGAGDKVFANYLTIGDPVTDGTNGTPRTATETRIKSFGVRWQIKAAGTAVNPGTVDVIALSSQVATLAQEAMRKDTDWSAGLTVPEKVTILKNTLQTWEIVPGGAVNVTSAVASVNWTGLSDYRLLRLSGIFVPGTDNAVLYARVGTGTVDTGVVYSSHRFAVAATAVSVGYSGTLDAFITVTSTVGNANANRWAQISFNLADFNKPKTMLYSVQTNFFDASAAPNIRTHTGFHIGTTVRDTFSMFCNTGNVGAGSFFVLEGLRG